MVEQFRIEALLGSGGIGEVYRAFDTVTHRHVAIKAVYPQLAVSDKVRRRFENGGRLLAGLSHDNIVGVHGMFRKGSQLYLVMEYLPDRSLYKVLETQPQLPADWSARVICGVLTALEYAHSRNPPVIHRDIKPGNIIVLREPWRVVVMDFDIAKFHGVKGMTEHGDLIGTFEYISPEQIQGGEVSPRSDLYAVGITLYEMLAGGVPFPQVGRDKATVLFGHAHRPVPPLPGRPDVPARLRKVLEKSLAKDPRNRYASAAEFRGELEIAAGLRPAPSFFERVSALALSAGLLLVATVVLGVMGAMGMLDDLGQSRGRGRGNRQDVPADAGSSPAEEGVVVRLPDAGALDHGKALDWDAGKVGAVRVSFPDPGPPKRNRTVKPDYGGCGEEAVISQQDRSAAKIIKRALIYGWHYLYRESPLVKKAFGKYKDARRKLNEEKTSDAVRDICKKPVQNLRDGLKEEYLYLTREQAWYARHAPNKGQKTQYCHEARAQARHAHATDANSDEIKNALGICSED